jgi:hypothetical protein
MPKDKKEDKKSKLKKSEEKSEKPEKTEIKDDESSEEEISKNKNEEISEDEGDIPVDFSDLQEWVMSGSSRRVPVLDQVEIAPRIIGLEQGVSGSSSDSLMSDDFSDPFKYASNKKGENGEVKYISNSSHISTNAKRVDFTEVGRSDEQRFEQSGFFTSSREFMGSNSENIEKYVIPGNVDLDNVGREKPFERETKKYDPKLPSS